MLVPALCLVLAVQVLVLAQVLTWMSSAMEVHQRLDGNGVDLHAPESEAVALVDQGSALADVRTGPGISVVLMAGSLGLNRCSRLLHLRLQHQGHRHVCYFRIEAAQRPAGAHAPLEGNDG